jgi:hypothetical protein
VVSRSNIDNTNPGNPFDWDNKNYLKHAAALQLLWAY